MVPSPRTCPATRPWPASGARTVALWAALLLLLALVGLGWTPLFDVDEGAFTEATREMLVSGDWGHTTLNGEPRWDKPILSYWLQAASVLALGLNEAALRLPSALAGWGWGVALMLFAWPRWGWTAAVSAAGLLAGSLGVLLIGRAATADALLNLWLTLALLDLWRHLEAPGSPAARQALRRAAVWIALGLLTKGPVALLLPGAAVLIWLLGEPRSTWWPRCRALLGDPLAWALLVGLALPWYAYALNRHGEAFIDGFLVRHNLQRYGGPLEGHGGSLAYYLVVLPLLLLPWTPLALTLAGRLRTLWRRDALTRYLLGWAGFVLLFFSFSGTKLPHYVLYGCSPLALLAGRELQGWLRAGRARAGRGALDALLLFAALWPWLLVGLALGVQALAPRLDDAYYRALLGAPADVAALVASAVLASGVAGLATAWVRRHGPGRRVALPALGAVLVALLLQQTLVLLPWWGERLQGPVRAAAQAAHAAWAGDRQAWMTTAVQWGLHQPSFAVYLGQEAPRRAPRPGDLALVRRDRIAALAQAQWQAEAAAAGAARAGGQAPGAAPVPAPVPPTAWTVLFEQRGLVLLRWHGHPARQPPGAAQLPLARAGSRGDRGAVQ